MSERERKAATRKVFVQGWILEVKRWLPKISGMYFKIKPRKSVTLFVVLRRHFVVPMEVTQCSQKLEMHCCTPNFRKVSSTSL